MATPPRLARSMILFSRSTGSPVTLGGRTGAPRSDTNTTAFRPGSGATPRTAYSSAPRTPLISRSPRNSSWNENPPSLEPARGTQRDALDGRGEQPAVARELLQGAASAGRPQDRDEIARRHHRVEIARQHLARAYDRRQVTLQVVDHDRQDAGRALRYGEAGTTRHGVWRRRCRGWRGGRRRAGGGHVRRLADRLALAALDDLEVGGRQVGDVATLVVGDNGVERRETDAGAERGLVAGRLRRRRWAPGRAVSPGVAGRPRPRGPSPSTRRTRSRRACISALRSRPTATPADPGPCPTAARR